MDQQKFPKTAQAVQDLQNALSEFKQILETKKYAIVQQRQAYKKNISEKNSQLEIFSQASKEAFQSIDQAIKQIDKVLEENGSSNNNN